MHEVEFTVRAVDVAKGQTESGELIAALPGLHVDSCRHVSGTEKQVIRPPCERFVEQRLDLYLANLVNQDAVCITTNGTG